MASLTTLALSAALIALGAGLACYCACVLAGRDDARMERAAQHADLDIYDFKTEDNQ